MNYFDYIHIPSTHMVTARPPQENAKVHFMCNKRAYERGTNYLADIIECVSYLQTLIARTSKPISPEQSLRKILDYCRSEVRSNLDCYVDPLHTWKLIESDDDLPF